jgi:hypothetical protein
MIGDLGIPVPSPVGPKLCEHLEVFVNHLSERAPQALLFLIVETRSDRESDKMMYVPHASFPGIQGSSYVICQDLTPIPRQLLFPALGLPEPFYRFHALKAFAFNTFAPRTYSTATMLESLPDLSVSVTSSSGDLPLDFSRSPSFSTAPSILRHPGEASRWRAPHVLRHSPQE